MDLPIRATSGSGVHRKTVERIENGAKHRLVLAHLYLLAQFYGVSLRWVVGGGPRTPWPATAPTLAATELEIRDGLRAARQRAGLGTPTVAKMAGVNQSWLARVERGDVEIDMVRIGQVAKALGCAVIDLIPSWEPR